MLPKNKNRRGFLYLERLNKIQVNNAKGKGEWTVTLYKLTMVPNAIEAACIALCDIPIECS